MKKIGLLFLTVFVTVSSRAQSILENTQIRFFTHVESSLVRDSAGTWSHSFELGDMEMLLTSQITDNISLLAEPVFTADNGLELQRVMIKYSYNDYLNVSAGRLYTPIGLWNNRFYHQARVLTPTIDHPVIIADASDFGVLSNKDYGLQVSGDNISKVRFGYRLMVSNGYSTVAGSKKAITAQAFIEPVDNFKIGVAIQHDNFAAGTVNQQGVTLAETTAFNMYNASIMYYGGSNKMEFASEFYQMTTAYGNETMKSFIGFFVYAGYKINKLTPYFMYNKLNYDDGVVFFTKNNFTGSTVGLRYHTAPLSVIKLEGQFFEADDFKKLNRIEIMWAIGF